MRRPACATAFLCAFFAALPALARATPIPQLVTAKYIYNLSDPNGPVASSWASLSYDPGHKELYVVDKQDGTVGIFNDVGMEIYRFGQDSDLGMILSVAVADDGDLLVLASATRGPPVLYRCNFRGEPKERIELRDVPPKFAADFWPDTLVFRAGRIHLAQKGEMKVLVADASGKCIAAHDFYRELKFDQTKTARGGAPAMHTFNVDGQGTMLFTVAPMFKVYVVSPEGKVDSFGERGGAPGKFNITGGVARDEQGNFYVSDVLKCAVLVFSPEFEFIGQFGDRGWDRDEFIAPLEVAVADGKLYVSQSATRGVSVFQLTVASPPPPAPPPNDGAAAATP
jgi:DNA-binding beta-propeller fold protein YncE